MKQINFSLEKLAPFFDKIAKLTKTQRILISVLSFAVPISLFVWFSYRPQFDEINTLKTELGKSETELADAKKRAGELKKYQEEMKKVETRFNLAKRALPESKEISSLLTNIAGSGRDVGLDFLLFEPKAEILSEFYAEIPVAIQVTGKYYDAVSFFDKVSKLTRIINIRDIKIISGMKKTGASKEDNRLTISCTAVTYKFVEPPPEPPPQKPADKTPATNAPKK
jgi:type IV pilus assembly protein PilO